MKIFFIEGPDNTGKTTVVAELSNFLKNIGFTNICVTHCDKPEGKTMEEQINNQNIAYENMAKQLVEWNNNNVYDVVIFDRSWYGEYIYGTMYRKRDKDEVRKLINHYEDILLESINQNDISFILLNTDNVKFLVKVDDGKSISNADKSLITKEISLFNDIFRLSKIYVKNKICVKVTNSQGEFKSKSSIFASILKKIDL